VGNLWADFQIVNFEQNSQPLYVMMSPDEQVLAPPRGYQEGVQDYAEFLECGLNTFQGLNSGAPSKGNKPLGSN
jgi:thiol:disulfide interchange protein DsbD